MNSSERDGNDILTAKNWLKNKLHVESDEAVEWMTPGDREDAHEEARWCTRKDFVCVCVCSSSGCGQGRDKTVTRYSSFTRLREYIARLHSYQQQLETKRNSKSEQAAPRWETWVYMGGWRRSSRSRNDSPSRIYQMGQTYISQLLHWLRLLHRLRLYIG